VATNELKMQILMQLANFGKIGKGDQAMKDKLHDDAMAEVYRKDPAYALQLLNAILEDGDQSEFLIALRQMAKAFGGVQAVAEQAQLNPTQLYRTLSQDGNPALNSFSAILKAMGMRLSVQSVNLRS
jgi:probable addiction module antidote protein